MSAELTDVEALLRSALVPVEPSERMTDRLERSLSEITDMAAGELADWEIGAMRDPRNWGRTAAAVVIGGAAAGGLVVVRARQARRREGASLRTLERSLRQVAGEIQNRLDR
jgi:hypothetical protein